MTRIARKRTVAAVVSAMMLAAPAVFACDLCRDAVATNSGSGSESSSLNFNSSVIFMLGTLFGVMGLIGRVMFKASKDFLPRRRGDAEKTATNDTNEDE